MEYNPPLNGDAGDPDRSYVNANPALGIEGSIPPAEAFEDPQREIVNVITGAGMEPDAANLAQLFAAIGAMIAAAGGDGVQPATTTVQGIVELATTDEAGLGTDTARVITAEALGAYIGKVAAAGAVDVAGDLLLMRDVSAGKNVSISLAKLRQNMIPNLGASYADVTGATTVEVVSAAANVNGVLVSSYSLMCYAGQTITEGGSYNSTALLRTTAGILSGLGTINFGPGSATGGGPFVVPAGQAISYVGTGHGGRLTMNYQIL